MSTFQNEVFRKSYDVVICVHKIVKIIYCNWFLSFTVQSNSLRLRDISE